MADIYSYITFILYGFVVGVLAKTLFPGKDEGGFVLTIILGILGSILGGKVTALLGFNLPKGFNLQGLIPALLGALLLLLIYKIALRFFKE